MSTKLTNRNRECEFNISVVHVGALDYQVTLHHPRYYVFNQSFTSLAPAVAYSANVSRWSKADFEDSLRLSPPEQSTSDSHSSKRVAVALSLLELVEGESPKAFDCLKGVMWGEQALKSTHLCYQCDDFHIPDENCELCGGEGEYRELHVIDWTTQKETLSLAFSELLRVARGKISE